MKNSLVIPSIVAINGEGGGGNIDLDKIIIKSDTIPTASEENYKRIYIYTGETNETYTHDYMYECKVLKETQSVITDFYPGKIGFDYQYAEKPYTEFTSDVEAMSAFIVDYLKLDEPTELVSGRLVVDESTIVDDHEHHEMWVVFGYDKDGNEIVSNWRLSAQSLKDYGFQFAYPPTDYHENEPINFTFNWTTLNNYYFERIDVQPSSGGSTYTAGTNIEISQDNVISTSSNVFTTTNLVEGTDIQFQKVPFPLIDEHTKHLYHFENNLTDSVGNENFIVSSNQVAYNELNVNWYQSSAPFFTHWLTPVTTADTQINIGPNISLTGPYSIDLHYLMQFDSDVSLSIGDITIMNVEYNHCVLLIKGIQVGDIYLGWEATANQHHLVIQADAENNYQIFDDTFCVFNSLDGEWYEGLEGETLLAPTTAQFTLSSTNELSANAGLFRIAEFRITDNEMYDSTYVPITNQAQAPYVKTPMTGIIVNNTLGVPSLTWYIGNTGTELVAYEITNKKMVKIYKNGLLLQRSDWNSTADYSTSGNTITFTTALESTDKICTEVL